MNMLKPDEKLGRFTSSLYTCYNKAMTALVECGTPAWNISGQTLFSGQAQVAKKSWMIKNISMQWKISGQLCFSEQAQVAQKSLMIKNIYSIQLIRGTLFYGQAQVAQKSWMIKNISTQLKNSGQLYFSGQTQVVQKAWMIKSIFKTAKNFRANSVFQGKHKLLKNPVRWKNFQYSV